MEIKNFGDLKEAILGGKEIHLKCPEDAKYCQIRGYDKIFKPTYRIRTKPEKEYVPFTADDWREFGCEYIKRKNIEKAETQIYRWDDRGVITYHEGFTFISYTTLLRKWVFLNGDPCGKEVIK